MFAICITPRQGNCYKDFVCAGLGTAFSGGMGKYFKFIVAHSCNRASKLLGENSLQQFPGISCCQVVTFHLRIPKNLCERWKHCCYASIWRIELVSTLLFAGQGLRRTLKKSTRREICGSRNSVQMKAGRNYCGDND